MQMKRKQLHAEAVDGGWGGSQARGLNSNSSSSSNNNSNNISSSIWLGVAIWSTPLVTQAKCSAMHQVKEIRVAKPYSCLSAHYQSAQRLHGLHFLFETINLLLIFRIFVASPQRLL
jgi:hypothetical protein